MEKAKKVEGEKTSKEVTLQEKEGEGLIECQERGALFQRHGEE